MTTYQALLTGLLFAFLSVTCIIALLWAREQVLFHHAAFVWLLAASGMLACVGGLIHSGPPARRIVRGGK